MARARTIWKWTAASFGLIAVLLAIGVGSLRVWIEQSPQLGPQVVARVEQLTGLRFAFARLDARLGLHGPEFVFREARITVPGQREPLVTASAGRVGFDVWRSLWTRRLAAGRVVLEGAHVFVYLTPDGIELRGQGALGEQGAHLKLGELPVGRVQIENGTVTVQDLRSHGRPWRIDRVSLEIERDPAALIVSAQVRLPDALGARLTAAARLEGDLALPEALAWSAQVSLKRAAIAGWTALVPQWPWLPRAGSGNLSVSAAGHGAVLASASALFDLSDVPLPAPAGAATKRATLAGELTVLHQGERWSASGRELTIDPGHDPWRRGGFDFEFTTAAASGALESLALRSPAIRLDALSSLTPLLPGGELREAAAALAPHGALTGVDLKAVRGAGPAEWRIDGALRFTALGFGPWRHVPGLTGLDGELSAGGADGQVRVHSNDFGLALPDFLRAPVAADQLSATLDWWWRPDGWRFAVDNAHSVSVDGQGGGKARLWIPADGESPRLVLDLALTDIDARAAPKYLPVTKIPPKALEWLDHAFLDGRVNNVRFELAGELRRFPFHDGGGLFRIRLPFEGIRLHYQDGFADVENARGEAEFRNQGLTARASSARVAGLDIEHAEVQLADFANAELFARATARGDARDGMAYLQQSPIGPKLGPLFMSVNAHGPISAEVTLDLPFTRFAERHVGVTAHFENVDATLTGVAAEFGNLSGAFALRDRDVDAPAITGTVLGGPLRVSVRTVGPAAGVAGERALMLEAAGRATGEGLQPLLGITHGRWLQGDLDWKAQARLPWLEWRPPPDPPLSVAGAPERPATPKEVELRPLPGTLRIDSTLAGLVVTLPAPLAKAAEEARVFRADLALDPGLAADATPAPAGLRRREQPRPAAVNARVQAGRDSAALEWRCDPDCALARGTLKLGAPGAPLRDGPGVWVEGHLPDYDVSSWLAVRFTDAAGPGPAGYLRGGSVSVDRFGVFGYRFADVTLALEGHGRGWRAQVDGPAARGTIIVPAELPGTEPLTLDMDRLEIGERGAGGSESAALTDPTTLPALAVTVRDLTVQHRHFGSLTAQVSRTEDGLQLDQAALQGASFEASGRGSWALTAAGQSSVVAFTLKSTNLLETLNAWGFAPTLTGRSGQATGELRWPGGIDGEILNGLGGHVALSVEQGQLISVDPGAGRVLGLMSVAALPRRLTLDFSDLTDKGFAFDAIKGDFDFRDGNAYTTNLVLKGPAGEIGIVGRTGLKARDYDQTAKVTGHLAGPIAAAGAVVAGPAVGAALLLFSKVFKEPLSGFARGYYRITGSWEKPRVERIGAGAAREAAAETAGTGGGR